MTPSTRTVRLWSLLRYGLFAVMVSALAACASSGSYQQDLMNAPDIYDEGGIDPFADISPIDVADYSGILYATDRLPADEPSKAPFYGSTRGNILRLGVARIRLAKEGATWEEARRVSLLKNRTESFPLQVNDAREYGVLDRTVKSYDDSTIVDDKSARPGARAGELRIRELPPLHDTRFTPANELEDAHRHVPGALPLFHSAYGYRGADFSAQYLFVSPIRLQHARDAPQTQYQRHA